MTAYPRAAGTLTAMSAVELLVALLMVIGVLGIVLPVLPGLLIVVGGVLLWALDERSTLGWWLLAAAVVLYLAGTVLQWLVPGRRMKAAGVRTSTLLVGVVVAVAMGFVIPVVGLFIGFPLGIFLVSLARTRDRGASGVLAIAGPAAGPAAGVWVGGQARR